VLGYPRLGRLTFAAAVLFLAAVIGTELAPSPAAFWITASVGLCAWLSWFGELLSSHSDRIQAVSVAESPGSWHWFGTLVLGVLIVVAVVLGATQYALFTVGNEMSPALRSGKRLLVRLAVSDERLVPNKVILFRLGPRNQSGAPGRWTVGRIIAGPGDEICLQQGRYAVNGRLGRRAARTWDYAAPLVLAEHPATTKVPAECYFIAQDSLSNGLDSAVLSWVARADVVSTELMELSYRRPLQPIDEGMPEETDPEPTEVMPGWRSSTTAPPSLRSGYAPAGGTGRPATE